jgi:N-acetylmuramoyl-L-alanine amidase
MSNITTKDERPLPGRITATRLLLIIATAIMVACSGSSASDTALPAVPTARGTETPPPATPTQAAFIPAQPTDAPESPTPTFVPLATDVTPDHPSDHATAAATANHIESEPSPTADATPASAPATETPQNQPFPSSAANDGPVIVLDPGHDRTTPGALGIEYQVNLHAAYIIKDALEEAGYRVYLTREDNDTVMTGDPSLLPPNASEMHPGYSHAYAHASKALQFDPDMVFILHFNGHPNPAVGGIEVYYCEMGGEQNLAMAEIMAEELAVAVRALDHEPQHIFVREDLTVARGNRHFPSMGNVYDLPTTWIENRYAGIPVVLTEPLYMTNAVELALIQDDATHYSLAQAYVRAADRWFGR